MKQISFLQQFILANRYIKEINKVKAFPYSNADSILDYQFKRIKLLLDIAYYHTDFYRKKYNNVGIHPEDIRCIEDFQNIPTITKEELIEFNPDFIDRRVSVDSLICSRSSGSSGKFVNLYFHPDMYITEEIQVIRMLKEYNAKYGMFDREVLVYTSEYPVSSILGLYKVFYVNNLLPASEIAGKIINHRPSIVAIYPSILRDMINKGIDISDVGIKAIITNSEYSSQSERDRFEEVIGCKVFDEFSSEELQSVFCQCRNKSYHDVPDCTYIELLQPSTDQLVATGEIGEIVGTCLINTAMPIIRYRSGDYASEKKGICECGKNTRVFENIEGRRNASIVRKDGSIIPSGRLLDWMYSLVLDYNLPLREFQIIQETISNIDIKLVVDPRQRVDYLQFIEKDFNRLFGEEYIINISIVPEIVKSSAGKHIPIITKVKA